MDTLSLDPDKKNMLETKLRSLSQNQAYFGLQEQIEWVLEKAASKANTFDDCESFLALLVADNLYTDRFLQWPKEDA